ncbi:hypothetical protein [Mesorhizobium sp. LjNodule214]|uniref:hypothetical protein n=1 Tax=Mesorhizobium sp. LjNodule214 TaxID=3342252 RepID=UPI003ED0CEA8
MRMLAMLGISLAAMAGGAQASSILVLGASTTTPSVVKLGAPEPMKIASAPSIVALGEAVPDVTDEKVAAIPDKPEQKHMQSPMIIRGGIVGGAFATPAAAPAKATAAAEPAAGDTTAAADGKPATATASNGEQQPAPQPEAAQPSPIAPVGKAM